MRFFWILATLVVFATAASLNKQPTLNNSEKIHYNNYQVYKIHVKNNVQLASVDFIKLQNEKYNIWKDYNEVSKEIHVMVKPQEDLNFLRTLKLNGIKSELMVPNVQKLIDEQENSLKISNDGDKFDWTRYYKLDAIENWLDGILAAYPTVTTGITIGKSYEKRNLRVIKISYKSGNPGIFIESHIHAREWITSATATWFINQLLTSTDAAVRNLAENYDWYIIPVFNVDGFVYSHEKDRMWRKTVEPIESRNCKGTDANRNFDIHWGDDKGASGYSCDESFYGSSAFSIPETAALSKYLTSIKDKIKIYLAFHSYGQYVLTPYGYSQTEYPSNFKDLQNIAKAYRDAVANLSYHTEYEYGTTSWSMFLATGMSVDWVYDVLGVKIAYTLEFRDKDNYGFLLPPEQILPNCEELMAGMIALVKKAKELKYI